MLPGFAFLFGLGSLFVAACNPTPRLAPEDPNTRRLRDWLYQCDHAGGHLALYNDIPADYRAYLEEQGELERCPATWIDLACHYRTSVCVQRTKYFLWRAKKEGMPEDYCAIWHYCYYDCLLSHRKQWDQ